MEKSLELNIFRNLFNGQKVMLDNTRLNLWSLKHFNLLLVMGELDMYHVDLTKQSTSVRQLKLYLKRYTIVSLEIDFVTSLITAC